MKVRVTFDVNDEERAAVGFYNRHLGKATHKRMKEFLKAKATEELSRTVGNYWEYFKPQDDDTDYVKDQTLFQIL